MFQKHLNKVLLAMMAGFISLAMVVPDAEAKRMGGGRSLGQQSKNVNQRAPVQQQQAAPAQQTPAQQAGAAPKPNRWLGPIAGLAAGLGIAALLSHMGLGGAMAEMLGSLLLIGLLVMAGLFVYRMMRGNQQRLAHAGNAPAQATAFDTKPMQPRMEPAMGGQTSVSGVPLAQTGATSVTGAPLGQPEPTWVIPADFDVDAFLHSAKVYFVRLQAAWDAADLADIREFTTPEMFAEIKLQLNDRDAGKNQTDVVTLEAELLGIEDQARDHLASVRFSGTMREAADAPAEAFAEIWNLAKPISGKGGWVLAGIQQVH